MAIPFFIDGPRNDHIRGKYTSDDLVWSDEFTKIDPHKWRFGYRTEKNPGTLGGQYKYQADLNRTAVNLGINRDGTLSSPDQATYGKRFAFWQDAHQEKTHKIINNQLYMGAYVSDEDDPTTPTFHPETGEQIHPYFDPLSGREVDLRKKVYTSWMECGGIARFNDPQYGDQPYLDPDNARHGHRYGYFEIDVDFREMNTPGFRQSWWLMPWCNPDANPELYPLTPGGNSVAGDGIAATGAEIDLFEYEPSDRGNARQALLMKMPLVFGPEWGRQNTFVDQFGYNLPDSTPIVNDLRGGMTTIGLEWNPDYLGYYVNGMEVNRDYHRVPQVAQTMYLTREGTAVCGTTNTAPAFHPYRPSYESGGWLWEDNPGAYLDRIIDDWCKISYVRIWQNLTVAGVWKSPHDQQHAIDPTTPVGNITRYVDAPAQGLKFGAPTRYSPNPTRSDIELGDTTVNVSTSTDDDLNLRYKDGDLLFNTIGETFDIKRVNIDSVTDSSTYVGSSNSGVFAIDQHGSGVYFVTIGANGEFYDSTAINVLVGSNSIDADGVQLPEGGTNTGDDNPDDVDVDVADDDRDIAARSGTFISRQPQAVKGLAFSVFADLAPNEDGTPADPDDYTYQWSVPDGVEIVGPDDEYRVTLLITGDVAAGDEVVRIPTCEILRKQAPVDFSFSIDFTQ